MPTGPSGARLSTGTMISAQPELKVPITPIRLLFCAYACAFEEHFSDAHAPSCAVASSHDWKPILYLPALKLCCLRMNLIASVICTVCARPEPCSGRSDAMT